MDGSTCATPGSCETAANDRIVVSYADATSECSAIGNRLCTKDELNTGVCCGTGGQCDQALVWTSTPDSGTYRHFILQSLLYRKLNIMIIVLQDI